jgi:hypothetical protein
MLSILSSSFFKEILLTFAVIRYLQTQLGFMDKCDVVRGWKETDTNLRRRIDEFVDKGFTPLLERACEPKPRRTLVHGDFGKSPQIRILRGPNDNDDFY